MRSGGQVIPADPELATAATQTPTELDAHLDGDVHELALPTKRRVTADDNPYKTSRSTSGIPRPYSNDHDRLYITVHN